MTKFKPGDRIRSKIDNKAFGTYVGELATVGDPAYRGVDNEFLFVLWDNKARTGHSRADGGFWPDEFEVISPSSTNVRNTIAKAVEDAFRMHPVGVLKGNIVTDIMDALNSNHNIT